MPRRAAPLVPLSWDHRNTLLLCTTIERSLAGDSRFGDGDVDGLRGRVLTHGDRHLLPHFGDEEMLLVPMLRRLGDEGAAFAARMIAEHVDIGAVLARVRLAPRDRVEVALRSFAALTRAHVRFEERELYPFVETHVDREALAAAALRMVGRRTDDRRADRRELQAVRGELFDDAPLELDPTTP